MFFERYSILTMLAALTVLTLTLLADVTDPFIATSLLVVGGISSGAFGLGLASLLDDWPGTRQPADADPPQPSVSLDPPTLPSPAGPDRPALLFADRIRQERDSVPPRQR